MSKIHLEGIVVLFVLFVILFAGVKNSGYRPSVTPASQQMEQQIGQQTVGQNQTNDLKMKLGAESDTQNASPYKGMVSIAYVSRSTNPSQEYVTLQVSRNTQAGVPITGWTLRSLSSGASVTIPKAIPLYFSGTINAEQNIVLGAGETVYLVTGMSPNGISFKLNKCSGYLTQFQTFVPYISASCPLARNEDQSKIPTYVNNDPCFDFIDRIPSCKTQTEQLPTSWSPECKKFITDLNYPSCVSTHKNDSDFYKPEWRVYLKRSDSVWKSKREFIVLYDANEKVVSTYSY